MYPYVKESQFAINGMIEAGLPFDTSDIKALTETILSDDGTFFDPIKESDLKNFMFTIFEKGYMTGYYVSTKYVCNEDGPKVILEFSPENALKTLDLIDKPKEIEFVRCSLHPQYKALLKEICNRANTTQDMLVRSLLVRALDSIYDQLK